MPLEKSTVLSELGHSLLKPDDYLRRIIGRLSSKQDRGHGAEETAWVRIGITGDGKAPNYRIEFKTDDPPFYGISGSYNGLSHRELVNEDILEEGNWSSERMSLRDIQKFLAQLLTLRAGR